MDIKKDEMISDEYKSLMELAKTCIEEGKLDDAMSHLARAASLETSRPEAFNLMGAAIEMRGDVLLAQKYYRAALSFDQSHVPSQKNLTRTVSWRREGQIVLSEDDRKSG